MHCILHFVDKVEEIGLSDNNIEWSSNENSERILTDCGTQSISDISELLKTFI